MRLKLISCEVLLREVCAVVATASAVVDPVFTPKGSHDDPDYLREEIQNRIDDVEDEGAEYDAILLGYGLCGNSTLGLTARSVPLIIPRAHDCCTLFLGSRQKFLDHFEDRLSAEWTSPGYLERGNSQVREADIQGTLGINQSFEELVEKYGEDHARYIWDTLHPDTGQENVIYIEIPELVHLGYAREVEKQAEREGKSFEKLTGSMRLIKKLICGPWDEGEFAKVPPGGRLTAVYDHEQIFAADPSGGKPEEISRNDQDLGMR